MGVISFLQKESKLAGAIPVYTCNQIRFDSPIKLTIQPPAPQQAHGCAHVHPIGLFFFAIRIEVSRNNSFIHLQFDQVRLHTNSQISYIQIAE